MQLIVGLTLRGVCPLLMHSERGVNPFDVLVKKIGALTSKRTNKTDEDEQEIRRLEWELGLYFDAGTADRAGVGPYIPGANVKKAIMEAATIAKGGMTVKRAVLVREVEIPLMYIGPRTIEGLWADEQYRDIRSVGIQRRRVMRCRPRFPTWGLEASMFLDASLLDFETFKRFVQHAGKVTGLGDYRPSYGRFTADVVILERLDDGTVMEDDDAEA